jgi:ABC-2 type transport system permease protein
MGFTDRLFAAPISRFAIVLGRLAGTAALGLVTAVWFLAIGLVFGAPIEEGVLGILAVTVIVVLAATAFGGLGAAAALRTGQASVVQGFFPLIFVILFLSSAFFPRALMVEPAGTIAEYNPLSFVAEGIRDPIVYGFSGAGMAECLAAVAGLGLLGLWLSALALRHRLRTGG